MAEKPVEENPEAPVEQQPESEVSQDEAVETTPEESEEGAPAEEVMVEELVVESAPGPDQDTQLKAVIEAAIYITDEPLSAAQIAAALGQPPEIVNRLLDELALDYNSPGRGLSIREVAGGYKMATKPEHHEAVRNFVKNLKPPLKLSLAALETLAVIAYKQPITAPEINEIRGVQGSGVLKTLIDRKLIATGGRKQVIGKPILYKTTKDFLVQFGLKDLAELPTLKEFEELGRLALNEPDSAPPTVKEPDPEPVPQHDPEPQPEPGPQPDPKPQPNPEPQPEPDPEPPTDPEQAPVTD